MRRPTRVFPVAVRAAVAPMTGPMLAAALAAMVGGCAVGPNYSRPAFTGPATFNATPVVAAEAAAPADLSRWWESFNDPLLTELVLRVQADNLDLAQALARVDQAKAGLNAATAALLPSGAVQASATQSHVSLDTPIGAIARGTGSPRDYATYEGDLTAAWEIDVFGGLRRGQQAALAQYQASQAGAVAARLAVTAQVADAYVVVRGLQQRLAVAFAKEPRKHVWFEIENEPHDKLNNANLVATLSPALAAIRESNPDRPVIVGGEFWSGVGSLATLELPDDPYIVPTFHYYEPFDFTHQGATWVEPVRPLGRSYGSAEDKALLAGDVAKVRAYIARTGKTPLLGEYGSIDKAPVEQRVAYAAAVRSAFDAVGVATCSWAYTNTFPLYDSAAKQWLPGMLEAVGAGK